MRKILALVVVLSLVIAIGGVASASIIGSKHDLSANTDTTDNQIADASTDEAQVCIFCHTPHGASNQGPLWNRSASTATYTVYSSGSLDATLAAPDGSGTAGLDSGSSADLCLSCHDGSVALNALINTSTNGTLPTMGASGMEIDTSAMLLESRVANLGIDLSNDHPVNFDYTLALTQSDGALVAPDTANDQVVAGIPLFGGKMQCSSCHNVHEPGVADTYPFLRASSTGSELCLKCHVK